jgi:hypothetical protein
MKRACWQRWVTDYLPTTPKTSANPNKRSLLEAFLHRESIGQADKWERWINAPPVAVTAQSSNLFRWHVDNQEDFPTLYQMALDILSIPAMLTECERVFSSAKKLITPARNGLKEDIIEAIECLKVWWDIRIIV